MLDGVVVSLAWFAFPCGGEIGMRHFDVAKNLVECANFECFAGVDRDGGVREFRRVGGLRDPDLFVETQWADSGERVHLPDRKLRGSQRNFQIGNRNRELSHYQKVDSESSFR